MAIARALDGVIDHAPVELDLPLARAATRAGVEIRYGTTVSRVLTRADGTVAGVEADGEKVLADAVVSTLDLPTWMAGVTVGGPVTTGAMLTGIVESMRLIALLAAFTVPPSLVSPHRTVRALPDGVAELGVITTVALTVTPAAAEHVRRLAETRRLRGRPHRGLRGLKGSITAVLEGSFDHSLTLAASMAPRIRASPTQARSRTRLLPNAATANGPMNSMVTATPSGIRLNEW